MKTDYETLKLDFSGDDGVLVVTLNRPQAANAMNTQMGADMRELWSGFYVDQQGVNCIVQYQLAGLILNKKNTTQIVRIFCSTITSHNIE